jgi:hypothetical protein
MRYSKHSKHSKMALLALILGVINTFILASIIYLFLYKH